MKPSLSPEEFIELIRTAFSPGPEDEQIALLVDLPGGEIPDNPGWQIRRRLVWNWYGILKAECRKLGLKKAVLFGYKTVRSNNAELPEKLYLLRTSPENLTAERLPEMGREIQRDRALAESRIVIAPTEFSATAPLKKLAQELGFRAATMPGFSEQMIPALRLNWREVDRRVRQIARLLDRAELAEIRFKTPAGSHRLILDLRFRRAHVSGGRFPRPKMVGNLPSGESYIVPFEGDGKHSSRSNGVLPVQFGSEIVLYEISENRAANVLSHGPKSEEERRKLAEEPAYGNLAELGFGILADFGIQPVGAVLLDEKLGLHVAFGRSDHFGGKVGPEDFRRSENVIHIDRIYIPAAQPDVRIESVCLEMGGGEKFTVISNGKYRIFMTGKGNDEK